MDSRRKNTEEKRSKDWDPPQKIRVGKLLQRDWFSAFSWMRREKWLDVHRQADHCKPWEDHICKADAKVVFVFG